MHKKNLKQLVEELCPPAHSPPQNSSIGSNWTLRAGQIVRMRVREKARTSLLIEKCTAERTRVRDGEEKNRLKSYGEVEHQICHQPRMHSSPVISVLSKITPLVESHSISHVVCLSTRV